jgi:hypothetical protein
MKLLSEWKMRTYETLLKENEKEQLFQAAHHALTAHWTKLHSKGLQTAVLDKASLKTRPLGGGSGAVAFEVQALVPEALTVSGKFEREGAAEEVGFGGGGQPGGDKSGNDKKGTTVETDPSKKYSWGGPENKDKILSPLPAMYQTGIESTEGDFSQAQLEKMRATQEYQQRPDPAAGLSDVEVYQMAFVFLYDEEFQEKISSAFNVNDGRFGEATNVLYGFLNHQVGNIPRNAPVENEVRQRIIAGLFGENPDGTPEDAVKYLQSKTTSFFYKWSTADLATILVGGGGTGWRAMAARFVRLVGPKVSIGAASQFEALVKAAQLRYPKLAGKTHMHHIEPIFLGGAVNGKLVPLDAAYHQMITNEFRALWPYGSRILPNPAQLRNILKNVYSKFPLPPGYSY